MSSLYKKCKSSEWLQEKLQKSLQVDCSSLERNRFEGKMEGWRKKLPERSHWDYWEFKPSKQAKV
jgi:hypothetical protein